MAQARLNVDLPSFRASLTAAEPPAGASPPLRALWWDAKGNWEKAHDAAQEDASARSSLVHAYLHRKEGDLSNAGYWYRRADRKLHGGTLDEEWQALAAEMLDP
jgi:hypothetical protein